MHVCVCACVFSHFSRVRLFATLWTVAHQPPLSIGLSRQEYWSGLPCLPPGDLPNPGIKPLSPVALTLQVDSLLLSHWESPQTIKAQANLTPTSRPWASLMAQRLKASACNAGDLGSIPESGRSPGEGTGNPLQCSCLENPRDGKPGGLPSMGSHRVGHD